MAKVGRPKQPTRRLRKAKDEGLSGKPRMEWLQLQLRETRAATRAAWADRSWVAVQALKRQERDVWTEIQAAREALIAKDPDDELTEDQALRQVVLPAVRQMGRPLVEELYHVCLELLGLRPEADEARPEARH